MRLRCLIIDDSDEFLASARRLLESQGVEVVGCASTSEEAARLASELAPAVALVDVDLGDEDGIALAAELEARMPSLRAILISAHDREDLNDLIAENADIEFL